MENPNNSVESLTSHGEISSLSLIMRYLFFQLIFLLCASCGFSQPYALLMQQKAHAKWDTVCTFRQNDILITNQGEIEFLNSVCLPIAYSGHSTLNFIFPNKSYFLIETKTVYTSTNCSYPCIQVHIDSIRSSKYKVDIPHLQDTVSWNCFVERWKGENSKICIKETPYMEIASSHVIYKGDTVNMYDDCHRKHGKWIVYDINNVFRKDSTTFFLPFDVTVLAEQYFENGGKVGSWTGYYHGGEMCFKCVFSNDSLVKGTFYREDGKKRYKFLHMKNGAFLFKDYTCKQKKAIITMEDLSIWLRL